MLFIVRDRWEQISPKARLVSEILRSQSSMGAIYIIRSERNKFVEKWDPNKALLSTTILGIFLGFFFLPLKSPRDLHDRILRRLLRRKDLGSLVTEGFISQLARTLMQYAGSSARAKTLLCSLKRINTSKIFLIDEFMSIRTLNLKTLKKQGLIIYVSQDVASDNYDFSDNFIARQLMCKLESEAVKLADLVIACTERDQLRYLEMNAQHVVYYPNIYPINEFNPNIKEKEPTICIVFQTRWGRSGTSSFNTIFEALSKLNIEIKVHVLGLRPVYVPNNIKLEFHDYIKGKVDFLKILSKSWVGINIGIHKGGSNERKYDYAMAGLVVISDFNGSRGDLLTHEYSFLDACDLAAKINQLIELGREKINQMGEENRKHVLLIAKKQKNVISSSIKKLLAINSENSLN